MIRQHQACQVCADPSAAFYCGANVCEACKKFFIRSWKQSSKNNYVCVQEGKCVITKETRKRCARCRYDRCLELKMYLPGGPSLLGEISRIPCRVCGAPSTGFHFGTLTCEGCKGFFRRCCQDKKVERLKCNGNDSCKIPSNGRGMCKACRLKKCFSVGMRAEKCKIGRRPNIVKHTTKLELQRIIDSSENFLDDNPSKFHSKTHSVQDEGRETSSKKHRPEVDRDLLNVNSSNIVENLETISDDAIERTFAPCSSKNFEKSKMSGQEIINDGSVPTNDLKCLNQRGGHYDNHSYSLFEKLTAHSNHEETEESSSTGTSWLETPSHRFKTSASAPETCGNSLDFGSLITSRHSSVEEFGTFSAKRTNFDFQVQPPGNNWSSEFDCSSPEPNCRTSEEKMADRSSSSACDGWGTEEAARTLEVKYSSPCISEKPSYREMVCIVKHSFSYLIPILSRQPGAVMITENSSLEEMWKAQMQQFERCALSILAFSRRIPGFKKLPLTAQIELIQKSLYPVVVCILSTVYNVEDNSFSYFSFSQSETKVILSSFPICLPLTRTLINMGQKVKSIDMDNIEVAFLCAVFLLDTGGRYEYKELLIDSLEFYVKEKHGKGTERHHHILMILRTMSDINQIHKQMIVDLLKDPKFSSLSIPQLYEEAFINSEYAGM